MSNIKTCFVSRWGEDGVIIEADYSQLEVIALAFLSNDKQLREDIVNKVDIHSVNAARLFNRKLSEFLSAKNIGDKITLEQRKLAKQLSFQLQYGSGAHSMALKNKIDKRVAIQFIKNYYDRYPQVKAYQESIKDIVEISRVIDNTVHTDKGFPVGVGAYRSITGRKYIFREYDNPYYSVSKPWTAPTNFSPTQIKNYPVQGFATGDIVPMMLGKLYREFGGREDVRMINTVHDSIVFDVRPDIIYTTAIRIRDILELTPEYLKEEFNIDFDLPLSVEIKCGKSWGELKTLDV